MTKSELIAQLSEADVPFFRFFSKTNSNKNSSGGTGFTGLLTILFIGLKLTHFINWPWIWVLSPILISLILFLTTVSIFLIFAIPFMTKSELIAQLSEADTGNELLEILENLETQDDDNTDD